ncbi:MAG TPA: Mov34/MPN/PAD-1 family protein [Candidatus Thermoplasmatota archaeon]|nr:Mov34/MPN/PAD-1 family protein [Candidatus Thermoplasmatota archaeon]
MGFWSGIKRFFGGADDRPRNEWGEVEPPPRPRRRVTKIRGEVLDLIAAMGKDAFPNEFGATLRAEGDTITEVILVPGTLGGDRHAILPLYSLPVDPTIVGTVHSHPSPNASPSDADLQLFRHFGHTHIIIGKPYTWDSWVAYDHDGYEIDLEIVV